MDRNLLPAPPQKDNALKRFLQFVGGTGMSLADSLMRTVFKQDAGFSLLPSRKLYEIREYTALAIGYAALLTLPPLL